MKSSVAYIFLLLLAPAIAFTSLLSIPESPQSSPWRSAPAPIHNGAASAAATSPLFHSSSNKNYNDDKQLPQGTSSLSTNNWSNKRQKLRQLSFSSLWKRLDTLESAGLPNAQVAGIGGKLKKLTKLHNPKTYMLVAAYCLYRYSWCFKSPYYWFAVGFLIKWYRARYVFKIPVWDRQPNWNNIITSPEQEKDLKAYTCKTCGSTIFIAKTREFFFEGSTGIGGLGCFSCGAKGKDNFVMDRDRIVEDVADEDDYFDYERPLDFISRAERREVMKEAGGDEEKANQLLVDRANVSSDTLIDKPDKEPIDVVVEDKESSDDDGDDTDSGDASTEIVDAAMEKNDIPQEPKVEDTSSEDSPKPKKKKKKNKKSKKNPADDEDLDVLGLDDF